MPIPDALRPLVDHAPNSLLVLDFDGTISQLVDHPDDAVAVEGVVEVVCDLAARLRVGFITGRPVDWLVARMAPAADAGVEFIGLHGHERLKGGAVVAHDESGPWRDVVQQVRREVADVAPDDVVVEYKGLGLALHFRTSPAAERWIRDYTADVAARTGLVAHDTRYAIELRPPVDLDKGHAMRELIDEHSPAAVAFFGDDLVDIPAVDAMRAYDGVTTVAAFVRSDEGPEQYAAIADLIFEGPHAAVAALAALRDELNG
jgi:trehalose-phosphatase